MTQKITKVAFIGLGVMGFPMAGHLQKAGFAVAVYNRTVMKAREWAGEYGGQWAPTPRQASEGAEVVFMCVGNDDDVRSVVYGEDGVLAGMTEGTVLVDHTTTSARLSEELFTASKQKGIDFIDAPVSGGQSGAENGKLTIFCGGEEAVFERIVPVLQAYGVSMQCFGPAGSGQRAKMVNQICIAGIVEALSEGIAFGVNAGLPMERVMPALNLGAAGSWQMEKRSRTMLAGEFTFGFAVDWMRKDLGFALDEAKRNGSELPLVALVDKFYGEVQEAGGGRWDTSSLITRLPQNVKK